MSIEDSGTRRDELRAQEEQFVNALLEIGPCPDELDADQVRTCGNTLRNKRVRSIERVLQMRGTECDTVSRKSIIDYCRANPGCHPKGTLADVLRFRSEQIMQADEGNWFQRIWKVLTLRTGRL